MADTNVLHFVDPNGLVHYHGTKVQPTIDNVTILQGYFNAGAAKNAEQLGGHGADYFATKAELDQAANESTWARSVADAKALKAVKAPKNTETRALLDTNEVYMFDANSDVTKDEGNTYYVPDDGTKGAWFLKHHAIYSPATATTDGLMSATDKKKLDAVQGQIDGKVDKDGYIAYTQAEKDKLAGLSNTVGTFYATVDVGSDTDVPLTNITIPAGTAIKVGDNIIDNQGGQYTVTKVTPASGSGDTAVAASVHVSAVGLQLALKSDVDAMKGKVNGLANIKTVGAGLALDEKTGTLTGTYSYTLPAAKADALGGVKVGSGITLGEDGTISVSIPESTKVEAATNDMIDAAFNA